MKRLSDRLQNIASIGNATLALSAILLLSVPAHAQVDRGSLAGTVRDSSGLVVPGASVTASQDVTGLRRTIVTPPNGTFDIPELPVGIYTVTVALKGFQTLKFESVQVALEHTTILNAVLQVAGGSERVEVGGSQQQLDQTSDTLGARIERKQVDELLLNGRNWSSLTALAPLAVDTNYNSSSNQRSMRVAGRGRDDNNFTLDGIDATNVINQAQQPYVRLAIPLDTIQEFRVVSMLATAETGATAGGQMAVTSASGTNQLHGGAFDFVRNDVFDARRFIDPSKPPFRLNQFGGSLGGPVMRNKTFFFASYEGYRQILGQTLVGFVPTAAFRQQVAAQSPALVPVLNAYPTGVLPVTGSPNAAEFVGYGRQRGDEDSGMVRVDHSFSDKTTAFVRLNIDRAVSNVPLASSSQYLADSQVLNSSPENGAAEFLHVFSPGLVNEAKFGFNRSTADTTDVNHTGALYAFSVPGFTTLNNNRVSIGSGNTFAALDNLTKIKGRNVLKAGVEVRRVEMNQGRTASGTVSFASLTAFAADQVNTAKYTQAEPHQRPAEVCLLRLHPGRIQVAARLHAEPRRALQLLQHLPRNLLLVPIPSTSALAERRASAAWARALASPLTVTLIPASRWPGRRRGWEARPSSAPASGPIIRMANLTIRMFPKGMKWPATRSRARPSRNADLSH